MLTERELVELAYQSAKWGHPDDPDLHCAWCGEKIGEGLEADNHWRTCAAAKERDRPRIRVKAREPLPPP